MEQPTIKVPLSAAYSAFFSSGLNATRSSKLQRRNTLSTEISDSWDDNSDYSLSYPSSPLRSLGDDSGMDLDLPEFLDTTALDSRRSVTPTPESERVTPVPSPQGGKQTGDSRPRLRRRRSSLTQSASPMNVIRSPSRNAGNALHLQMQLAGVVPRSRPSSLSGEALSLYGSLGLGMAATEMGATGRMRSGSCSSVNPQSAGVGLKSGFRCVITN